MQKTALGPFWKRFGSVLKRLESALEHLGRVWGHLRQPFGRSWALAGGPFDTPGRSWAGPGSSSEPLEASRGGGPGQGGPRLRLVLRALGSIYIID